MQNDDRLSNPQQIRERSGIVLALSHKQTFSLYKKSENSGIPFDVLKEVYERGYADSLSEQGGFNRVNSFIAGGAAAEMDTDLVEKRGLWDNIHAKRERIKRGSGERMRKPGSKGAPTNADFKAAQEETKIEEKYAKGYKSPADKIAAAAKRMGRPNPLEGMAKAASDIRKDMEAAKNKEVKKEEYTGAEKTSADPNDPTNRFAGTDSLTNNYKNATPGQSSTLSTIKKVVREKLEEEYYPCDNCTCGFAEEYIAERGADSKGYYRSTESGAGLTAKGAKHFGVGTAVTEKNPKGKRAARRKSFCARMGGMKGPMKDEKGRPTRKAMSLRRWRC